MQTKIEKEWRKGSKVNATLKGLRPDLEEPIFKPQDLWNTNAVLEAAAMSSLAPTQTLMKYLTKSPSWYVDSKKREYNDELEFLFFAPKCMQKLLRVYSKVLVMNCIYKTNRYEQIQDASPCYYWSYCLKHDLLRWILLYERRELQ